jgi:thioredoxin-related protein
MKKTLCAILVCAWMHLTFAAGVSRVPQLEDAYAESQNTKRSIVAIFGAEWCLFCKKLEKDLVNNPEILDDYIYVYIDIDERQDLKKEYAVKNIPDIMILDHEGIETKRIVGYKSLDHFRKWLEQQ